MPMSRVQKTAFVEQLHSDLVEAQNLVVLDFRGLKVAEVDEFRRRMRQSRSVYRVVKNTLALRALHGTGPEALKEHFDGPTAIALNPESLIGLAKVIREFRADHEALKVKAAWLDGKVISQREFEEISRLPGLPELRAQVLWLLVSPLQGFVSVLGAAPREMAVVLSEHARKREEAGEGAPAPAEAVPAEGGEKS